MLRKLKSCLETILKVFFSLNFFFNQIVPKSEENLQYKP